jgi:hypothetical protein
MDQRQDNELTLTRDAVIAAETRAVLDLNHDFMLKQMAAKNRGQPQRPSRQARLRPRRRHRDVQSLVRRVSPLRSELE